MEFSAAARNLEPALEQAPKCSGYGVPPDRAGYLRRGQRMLSFLRNRTIQIRALGP